MHHKYTYTYIHIYENQRSPQAKATTQPTKVQKKNWLELRFWPILATFSSVGLALGWEIRRFHTIFIDFFFPTQHSLVNRQHLNVRTVWAFIWIRKKSLHWRTEVLETVPGPGFRYEQKGGPMSHVVCVHASKGAHGLASPRRWSSGLLLCTTNTKRWGFGWIMCSIFQQQSRVSDGAVL